MHGTLAKVSLLQVALEMLLRDLTVEIVNPSYADAEQFIIFNKNLKPLLLVHDQQR